MASCPRRVNSLYFFLIYPRFSTFPTSFPLSPIPHPTTDSVLRNYGSNVSLIAALRLDGMVAPFVIEGAINPAVFETYIERILARFYNLAILWLWTISVVIRV